MIPDRIYYDAEERAKLPNGSVHQGMMEVLRGLVKKNVYDEIAPTLTGTPKEVYDEFLSLRQDINKFILVHRAQVCKAVKETIRKTDTHQAIQI